MKNKNMLIDYYICDLKIDIECAIRDGLTEYANEQQTELDALLKKDRDDIIIGKYGIPK